MHEPITVGRGTSEPASMWPYIPEIFEESTSAKKGSERKALTYPANKGKYISDAVMRVSKNTEPSKKFY